MPSGKTHDLITYTTAPLVAVGTYYVSQDIKTTAFVTGSYAFAALMFSGDLDLKSRQTNRWGLLEFIWLPYRKFFSHRSTWTHGVIQGTFIRIIYLFLAICFLIGATNIIGSAIQYLLLEISFTEWLSQYPKAIEVINHFPPVRDFIYQPPSFHWNVPDFILFVKNLIVTYPKYAILILIGLILGAFSHTGADVTVSAFKKWKNAFKKKRKKLRSKKYRSKKG